LTDDEISPDEMEWRDLRKEAQSGSLADQRRANARFIAASPWLPRLWFSPWLAGAMVFGEAGGRSAGVLISLSWL